MSGVICAYAVSGGYGPIARYLYYTLLFVSLAFHHVDWLVGGTLGASMVYSSTAAVHAIALASNRGRSTVDLDIIPAFAITGVGMVIGAPLLVWSKRLREAETSVRLVIFAWIVVMFVGTIASMASMKALPDPVPCNISQNCPMLCNIPLPMRDGQPILVVPFRWKDLLFNWSGWFAAYGSASAFAGVLFASSRQHPREMVLEQLRQTGIRKRLREKNAGHVACCALFSPAFAIASIITQIIITEFMMMGPQSLPFGENMTAIGQWGPLVGVAFALLGSVMQQVFSDPSPDVENRTPIPPPQLVAPAIQQVYSNPLDTPHDVEKRTRLPALGAPPLQHRPPRNVAEGAEWGAHAEGVSFSHCGCNWIVRNGVLRCADTNAPPSHCHYSEPSPSSLPVTHSRNFIEGATWGDDVEGISFLHDGINWTVRNGILRSTELLVPVSTNVTDPTRASGCLQGLPELSQPGNEPRASDESNTTSLHGEQTIILVNSQPEHAPLDAPHQVEESTTQMRAAHDVDKIQYSTLPSALVDPPHQHDTSSISSQAALDVCEETNLTRPHDVSAEDGHSVLALFDVSQPAGSASKSVVGGCLSDSSLHPCENPDFDDTPARQDIESLHRASDGVECMTDVVDHPPSKDDAPNSDFATSDEVTLDASLLASSLDRMDNVDGAQESTMRKRVIRQ